MEADFGETPEESMLEKQIRLEPIKQLVEDPELLTERERWVIEGYYWRQRSFSQIAGELGLAKSTVFRIRDEAFKKIREAVAPEAEVD